MEEGNNTNTRQRQLAEDKADSSLGNICIVHSYPRNIALKQAKEKLLENWRSLRKQHMHTNICLCVRYSTGH